MPGAPANAEPARSLLQRPPWNRRWCWFLLSAAILAADYLCGPFLLFPILFIVPVMLAGWNRARRDAVAIALFLTAARFGFSFLWDPGSPMAGDIVNTLIRGIVLVSLGILVSRVADQNAQLSRRLKQLEGLLAICSHCKKILDEENRWTRLETYIVEHSQAEFSHGVCPECAKLHYGVIAPREDAF